MIEVQLEAESEGFSTPHRDMYYAVCGTPAVAERWLKQLDLQQDLMWLAASIREEADRAEEDTYFSRVQLDARYTIGNHCTASVWLEVVARQEGPRLDVDLVMDGYYGGNDIELFRTPWRRGDQEVNFAESISKLLSDFPPLTISKESIHAQVE